MPETVQFSVGINIGPFNHTIETVSPESGHDGDLHAASSNASTKQTRAHARPEEREGSTTLHGAHAHTPHHAPFPTTSRQLDRTPRSMSHSRMPMWMLHRNASIDVLNVRRARRVKASRTQRSLSRRRTHQHADALQQPRSLQLLLLLHRRYHIATTAITRATHCLRRTNTHTHTNTPSHTYICTLPAPTHEAGHRPNRRWCPQLLPRWAARPR